MRRGDIYLVDFGRAAGASTSRLEPAVIVTNNGANRAAARTERSAVTVVPLTTRTETVFPFQVILSADDTKLGRDTKAHVEQVRSLSALYVDRKLGRVPLHGMRAIDDALRLHLGLN